MTAFERTVEAIFTRTAPSASELQVLELWVVEGLDRTPLAERLGVSPKTVDAHIDRMRERAGAHDVTRHAFERRLLMVYATELHRDMVAQMEATDGA